MIRDHVIGGKSNRAVLFLALFLGLVSAVLVLVFLNQAGGDGGGGGGTQPAVVAAQDIPAGTRITAEMVQVKPIPTGLLLPHVFGRTEDVVGKVAEVALVAGEQVVPSRVVTAGEEGQIIDADALAQAVPLDKQSGQCAIANCGLRAVSINVAEVTAAGGLIRPGDRVDVLLSFEDGSAVTIVQDVEVLALGQNLENVVVADGGEAATPGQRTVIGSGEEEPQAASATLAVWPEEAQILAAGEEMTTKSDTCKGSVRLALRHQGQHGPVSLPPKGTCASSFADIWALQ